MWLYYFIISNYFLNVFLLVRKVGVSMNQKRGLSILLIFCLCMLCVVSYLFFQKSKKGWKNDASQDHLFSIDFESDSDITSIESFFSEENEIPSIYTAVDNQLEKNYMTITSKEAKDKMDKMDKSDLSYIILDVRTPEEYEEEHIENAVLLPDYEIDSLIEETVPDKKIILFVYCRSGRRSAAASQKIADLGYETIYDFGGIINWPFETVTY